MADVTYPKGMSEELASRLYGRVEVPWSAEEFAFDPVRSECRFWLDAGQEPGLVGVDYQGGSWPQLVNVIRRGDNPDDPDAVRVFQWSNGLVYEQET